MSEPERQRISNFVEQEFGIKMPAAKKSLLEGRLAKRLVACGIADYGSYFDFVTNDPNGRDEYLRFADLVSTHETSFFREDKHFTFLENSVLPQLFGRDGKRTVSILSAACSTGEEVYTLAMLVDMARQRYGRGLRDFIIEGVDLSDHAVAVAKRGVYLLERTGSIPLLLRHQYLMLGKDGKNQLCRFVPELRKKLNFHTGNLLGHINLGLARYDLIFCRNVLIYFSPENQQRVIRSLLNHLEPNGLLFLGHSETMVGQAMQLRSVAHAVFQKA